MTPKWPLLVVDDSEERIDALEETVAELLGVLEQMQTAKGCFDTCRWEYSGRHHGICIQATYAIAKAKGA